MTVCRCDVLVVGGGPAGSACAGALRVAGADVVVLDKAVFPREKVCAGWVTPGVFRAVGVEPEEYGDGRILQPFMGFRVGIVGAEPVEVRYGRTVSYGIRRSEFDDFLLARSGARLRLGEPLRTLARLSGGWLANGEITAEAVVGAGGHFCPTQRLLGARGNGELVVAQAAEVLLETAEARRSPVDPEVPELYFSRDLQGYGWCLRKGNFLNVGLGRAGDRKLGPHMDAFFGFLARTGRIPPGVRLHLKGHAYRLEGGPAPEPLPAGVVRIGDAAGLARTRSGEGIGPSVASGLRAARRLAGERTEEPGVAEPAASTAVALIPASLRIFVGRALLRTAWFARHVVLDRWFLDTVS